MSLFSKGGFAVVLVVFAVLANPRASQGQSLTFTTFAGSEGGAGFDDGNGTAARFDHPTGVATDRSGNVYVGDARNHTVRKITPAGAVTTLAGLAGTSGSADGMGSAARFFNPSGVATDSSGNVYVADSYNQTIRKITPSGAVTTLAGLARNEGSDDGTRSAARFSLSFQGGSVATDRNGNVYVADAHNHTIRKISPQGEVTTLAGLAGISGRTDGTGSAARFDKPSGVATDSTGNVYVADTGNDAIRKITPDGAVATLAGFPGTRFDDPLGVASDSSGNVYVTDEGNTIRKITPAGVVTTLAGLDGIFGSVDGTGNAARFGSLQGVATDTSGNVYVADWSYDTIRRVTQAGAVTTLAGLAETFGSADGTGSTAQFRFPAGVATDSSGNVYVADAFNVTIRKITPSGAVTTLAGLARNSGSDDGVGSAARFSYPFGVATDSSGNVYVSDNDTIRKITTGGAVTTLAGLARASGSADGTGNAARFDNPAGVATDRSANIYVADSNNSTIRKITPAGAVTTLAGLAQRPGHADGTESSARFDEPSGVATDSSGNVYVADRRNHTIRKITLAGLAQTSGSADGPGSAARFALPIGVATDNSGNVYVADTNNHTIRKITPDGAVTTLAGLAQRSGTADGTGNAARFAEPYGVATDSRGNVYVADSFNRIRIGRPALADVATVGPSTGTPGTTRQLDTSPQTAFSWQWSVIRRPADSAAILSSSSVRNPTFTPDVPGLFTFRLIATGAGASSITTVDLNVSVPGQRRRAVGR